MNISDFEEELEKELKVYEEIYAEYNMGLEKALSLIEQIRVKIKDSQRK